MIELKQLVAGAAAGFATLAVAVRAEAFTFLYTCNGCTGKIGSSQEHVRQNLSSIAAGGARESDLFNASTEWNTRVMSRSPVNVSGTTSDTVITHGDGQWEAGVVARSTIGGNNGLTVIQWGTCFIGCNDMDEADPMVASDLLFGNPDESGWDVAVGGPLSGRDVFVHEWGHVLGLGHQTGYDVMIPGGLKPRVGGTGTHSTPSGDDRNGAATLYGGPSSFKNLLASGQRFSGGAVTTTSFAGTIFVTLTTVVDMNYALVNHGTQNLTFNWREHINTCPTCGTGGITWTNWTGAIVNNRNQVFTAHSTTAPVGSMACNTTFWTFHTVDTGSAHAESRETDNVVHHATTLSRVCI